MSDFARQSRRDAPIEAPRIASLRWVSVLIVVMVIGGGMVYLNSRGDSEQAASTAARVDPNAAVDALIGTNSVQGALDAENALSEAERLVGQTVKVRAGVDQVLNERAFLIDADGLGEGRQLLVLSATEDPQVAAVRPGHEVVVQGQIIKADVADLATNAGIDLDSAFIAEYGEQPVLVTGGNITH